MFANTPSGELSNHCSIHKVYVVQENVHSNQVFHNWNIFHTNTKKTGWISFSNFLYEQCEHFLTFFLMSRNSMQVQSESSKET